MPYRRIGVAPFSSGASLVFPGAEGHHFVTKPDVVAPGVQILSCVPPHERSEGFHPLAYCDGSSMASPHVSGVAALLMAAHPEAPVRAIVRALKETSYHPGGNDLRPDNRWGYGMIRPIEALKALR
jgi:serine protease AprX